MFEGLAQFGFELVEADPYYRRASFGDLLHNAIYLYVHIFERGHYFQWLALGFCIKMGGVKPILRMG